MCMLVNGRGCERNRQRSAEALASAGMSASSWRRMMSTTSELTGRSGGRGGPPA
jgi:hypothetical protein